MKRDTDIPRDLENAFMELYAQYPIEKISIKMVTALAGLNRCTFYLHYSDIYDLRDRIVQRYDDMIRAKTQAVMLALLRSDNISAKLDDISVYRKNLRHIQILFCLPGKSDLPERMKQEFKDFLRTHLVPGAPCGEFALEYCACAILSVITLWFQTGCETDIEELGRFVSEATAHGLGAYLQY